jgi:hypothetical protein
LRDSQIITYLEKVVLSSIFVEGKSELLRESGGEYNGSDHKSMQTKVRFWRDVPVELPRSRRHGPVQIQHVGEQRVVSFDLPVQSAVVASIRTIVLLLQAQSRTITTRLASLVTIPLNSAAQMSTPILPQIVCTLHPYPRRL